MGAGGLAREFFHYLAQSGHEVIGFYSEKRTPGDQSSLRAPIVDNLAQFAGCDFIVAVGDPVLRERFWNMAKEAGLYPCEPVICPGVIAYDARIMRGTMVCPGVILTDGVSIGANVVLNLNVTVGHGAVVERHSVVSPAANISGDVVVREKSYIGTNASIREKVEIGAGSLIGMGTTIVKNVPPGSKMIGAKAVRIDSKTPNVTLLKPIGGDSDG